jgi:hypothetical protein
MNMTIEDGLYRAHDGQLSRIDTADDGLKKIRVAAEVFEGVREVQKRMRRVLSGRKPDIGIVAEAMLMHAARTEGIEDVVKQYAASVFAE